ncbi:MAG TPA: hypothetical protein VN934_04920 [Candidatus Tumulicola sp.]|nr:hypothetical protein [Candidatus Tumulicola sp.]
MKSFASQNFGFALLRGASALAALAVLATSCGRGPVTPSTGAVTAGTITFQFTVSGTIVPSQGDYIIAVNSNTDPNTDVNSNETPGEPTVAEAQAGTFTHWDQEFVYGFDTSTSPNGFALSYKAVTAGGGITFVPIILTTNQFIFNPTQSVGGTNNTFSITLPIAIFSIRANTQSTSPPTVTTPPAVRLHVNYITTDTGRTPQDQLGCCGVSTTGFDLVVLLNAGMQIYQNQLTTPPGKPGPSNPNLFITGGMITVNP